MKPTNSVWKTCGNMGYGAILNKGTSIKLSRRCTACVCGVRGTWFQRIGSRWAESISPTRVLAGGNRAKHRHATRPAGPRHRSPSREHAGARGCGLRRVRQGRRHGTGSVPLRRVRAPVFATPNPPAQEEGEPRRDVPEFERSERSSLHSNSS